MESEVFLKIEGLRKTYGSVNALADVNLTLEYKKQYAILGSSGSGKSTLLYLLGGLDRASDGAVYIEGDNLSHFSDEELAAYRNKRVGFVFQFHFLLPSMNCLENILLPSKISGLAPKEIIEKVSVLAQRLGVAHCLEKFPYELSGGEQQRVNIIRALSLKPELLLCDEPTGNLDSVNSKKVVELLKELANDYGSTLIVVTHDLEVAKHFEDRVIMKDGKIDSIESGAPLIEPIARREKSLLDEDQQSVSNYTQEVKKIEKSEEVDIPRAREDARESDFADSVGARPRGYTGIDKKESQSTEELLEETQQLLRETQKILSSKSKDRKS